MTLRYIVTVAVLLICLMVAPSSWAHGTRGSSQPAEGIRVKAEYDDGEPMSYAAVQINAPQEKLAFQKGRTDRNGVFMFAPDRPGKWRIVVNDEMGHRLALEQKIDAAAGQADTPPITAARETTGPPLSRWEGAVAGLAIIFGLCCFFYGWKANRRLRTFHRREMV